MPPSEPIIPTEIADTLKSDFPKTVVDSSNFFQNDLLAKNNGKSRKPEEDRFLYKVFKKDYPQPKKALYASLAFPGLGQIYNKRWWKVPLVWGGMAFFITRSIQDTDRYILFRDALVKELNNQDHRFSGVLNASTLRRLRDAYDSNRQWFYVGVLGVYVVAGAEAFVDAHLRTFDVSDDLSLKMNIKPSIELNAFAQPSAGVSLSFSLVNKTQTPTFHILSEN